MRVQTRLPGEPIPMFNVATRALMLAAAFALQAPVHATVLLGGATPEETALLTAQAHQAGARHSNVVGLTLEFSDGDVALISYATGVYIGLTADGQTGLILSAGHAFDRNVAPKGLRGPKRAWVSLGPRILDKSEAGSVMIPAVRVDLHPEFGWSGDGACAWTYNDLAIVAFDASAHREVLQAQGLAPAKLRAEHEAKAPMCEAELVGEGKDTVYFGFDRVEAGFAIVDPETGARTELRSHPKQAFGARGDSGGPLFFTTPGGLEVAGIYSGSLLQRVAVADAEEDEMVHTQVWEPVAIHLPWIQSHLERPPGSPSPGPGCIQRSHAH